MPIRSKNELFRTESKVLDEFENANSGNAGKYGTNGLAIGLKRD